jgi:hypothetical protein
MEEGEDLLPDLSELLRCFLYSLATSVTAWMPAWLSLWALHHQTLPLSQAEWKLFFAKCLLSTVSSHTSLCIHKALYGIVPCKPHSGARHLLYRRRKSDSVDLPKVTQMGSKGTRDLGPFPLVHEGSP